MEKIKSTLKYILIIVGIILIAANIFYEIKNKQVAKVKTAPASQIKNEVDTVFQKDIWKDTEFMK